MAVRSLCTHRLLMPGLCTIAPDRISMPVVGQVSGNNKFVGLLIFMPKMLCLLRCSHEWGPLLTPPELIAPQPWTPLRRDRPVCQFALPPAQMAKAFAPTGYPCALAGANDSDLRDALLPCLNLHFSSLRRDLREWAVLLVMRDILCG